MMHSLVCDNCQSRELLRSRIRHAYEYLILWMLVPYRCHLCAQRQFKFRFLDMENPEDTRGNKGPRQIRRDR